MLSIDDIEAFSQNCPSTNLFPNVSNFISFRKKFRSLASDLAVNGYGIIDGIFGDSKVNLLLRECDILNGSKRPDFYRGEEAVDYVNPENVNIQTSVKMPTARDDRFLWIDGFDSSVPTLSELTQLLQTTCRDELEATTQLSQFPSGSYRHPLPSESDNSFIWLKSTCKDNSDKQPTLSTNLKRRLTLEKSQRMAMYAEYLPGSKGFVKHLDNSGLKDTRLVTAIYYIQGCDGGELVLYPSEEEEIIVEPKPDRMVLFLSDEVEHEVKEVPLSSTSTRSALSYWYHKDTGEIDGAKDNRYSPLQEEWIDNQLSSLGYALPNEWW
eukprot:CAMPEP_0167764396 /NCGR_PEP_ID=MMETSP0110_2-20121227/14004_1 /TAXON_ID=629695 /ORGANISM="Gymnochlora sp., Strain CCMP2014" /LENGTH=323 /DNA_ID=CAMNT_0007651785 /DNA_START=539 /DNA_END=1510 /DNA_ORIENTATION=-